MYVIGGDRTFGDKAAYSLSTILLAVPVFMMLFELLYTKIKQQNKSS